MSGLDLSFMRKEAERSEKNKEVETAVAESAREVLREEKKTKKMAKKKHK
jgi:hypothetical protein